MINQLTNSRPRILLDKWRFNISQDWEVLKKNFSSVSSEIIQDATLRALDFHYSPLCYFEERVPWFVHVTDKSMLAIEELKCDIEPITELENEKVKKMSEHAAKRKARRNNLYVFVLKALAASFTALLLPCPPMLTVLSCYGSLTLMLYYSSIPSLSSYCLVLNLSSCLLFPGLSFFRVSTLLSFFILAPSSSSMPAPLFPPLLISSSCSILDLALIHLISLALKIFKRALSDKPLGH